MVLIHLHNSTRGQVNESAITAAREAGGTQALQVEELLWEQIADESSKTTNIILQMLSALKVIKVASTPEQGAFGTQHVAMQPLRLLLTRSIASSHGSLLAGDGGHTVQHHPAPAGPCRNRRASIAPLQVGRRSGTHTHTPVLTHRTHVYDADSNLNVQEGGHFGRVRRSIMDGKDKVAKGDAAASTGQKDAKAQEQVDLQEDVGMWDSNSMEGGLIFEKAAAELRQSEDPDKKAGAGSLSRVVRAASLNKLVELLTSDEEHGNLVPLHCLLCCCSGTFTNCTRTHAFYFIQTRDSFRCCLRPIGRSPHPSGC